MDDQRLRPSTQNPGSEKATGQLRDKRRQLQTLLADQRDQLAALEQALHRQFERLQSAVTTATQESGSPVDLAEVESQRAALAAEAQSLAELSTELDERQAALAEFEGRLKDQEQRVVEQLASQQAELDERAAELEAASVQLRQAQRALAASEEELVADREHVAHLRERLQEQVHAVERERDGLAARRSDTNNQRRRIARDLQQQRNAQKAELAREREVVHRERDQLHKEQQRWQASYQQQLSEIEQRRAEAAQSAATNEAQLQQQADAARKEAAELQRQLSDGQQTLRHQTEELATLRKEHTQAIDALQELQTYCEELQAQQTGGAEGDDTSSELVRQLRDELAIAHAKLEDAEQRAQAAAGDGDGRKREDLKRRFELAVEDIRELKRRNADLEEKLSEARAGKSGGESTTGSGTLDWEAQKRKLLAALEADDDDSDDAREERMSIEGTIRITDEIVARRDDEIAELKRILEEQSSNLGNVAVGATAIAEMIDQDELVRQERENLARLQEEWREKLRQAEIDISLERARMARERIELDEKLQSLESERAKLTGEPSPGAKGESGSAAQRRWWARLGLKEQE